MDGQNTGLQPFTVPGCRKVLLEDFASFRCLGFRVGASKIVDPVHSVLAKGGLCVERHKEDDCFCEKALLGEDLKLLHRERENGKISQRIFL